MTRSVIAAAALACAAGCAHSQPQVAETPPPAPQVEPQAPAPVAAAPTPASCHSDTDCASSELCVASRCVAIRPGLAECAAAPVHFGYDEARVRDEDRPILQRAARCIEADATAHVQLEGNADERGSTAYNVALGSRRAGAVQEYLVALGVPALRLKTTSFGKEKPVCAQHEEACWSLNRRVDLDGAVAR